MTELSMTTLSFRFHARSHFALIWTLAAKYLQLSVLVRWNRTVLLQFKDHICSILSLKSAMNALGWLVLPSTISALNHEIPTMCPKTKEGHLGQLPFTHHSRSRHIGPHRIGGHLWWVSFNSLLLLAGKAASLLSAAVKLRRGGVRTIKF